MSTALDYCTFYVAGHRLGLPVGEVLEVVRHTASTPVPLAPPGVVGLVTLRGRIVIAVDLKARLGWGATPSAAGEFGVVLSRHDGALSLLVDGIGEVRSVEAAHFEHPPETIDRQARELLAGTYRLPDGLLLALEAARTVPDAAVPVDSGA